MSKRRSSRERKNKTIPSNTFRSVIEKGRENVEKTVKLDSSNEKTIDHVKSTLKDLDHTIHNFFISHKDNKTKLIMVKASSRLGQVYYIFFTDPIYAYDYQDNMISVTRLNDNVVNRETEDFYISKLPEKTSITIIANSGFSVIGRDEVKDTFGYDDYEQARSILELEKFNISVGPCYLYEEVMLLNKKFGSIYDITRDDSDTYMISKLIKSSGTKDMLCYTGDYVMFVPYDDVVELYEETTKQNIDDFNDTFKKSLILNHIIHNTSINFSDEREFTTLQGEQIVITKKEKGYYIGDIKIEKSIKASNGTIYMINGMLVPQQSGYPEESAKYLHVCNDYTINKIYIDLSKTNYSMIMEEYNTLNNIFELIRDHSDNIIRDTKTLYKNAKDDLIPYSSEYLDIVSDGSENQKLRNVVIEHNLIISDVTSLAMKLISMKKSLSSLAKKIQDLDSRTEIQMEIYDNL